MKPEEMIAVAVRLFALALAIFSMRELSAVIWSLDSYYGEDAKFAVYVIGTITLLVALLLWRFPLTVSKFIYSKNSDDHLVSPIGVRDLYNLGFVILGFFVLIRALADGVYWSLYVFWLSGDGGALVNVDNEQIAASAATLAEVLIGLLLIIGCNKLTNVVHKSK